MAAPAGRAGSFEWVGGALCLDFANTVSRVTAGETGERLSSWSDVAAWGRAAGLALAGPRAGPDAEGRSVGRARRFRAALHEIFDSVAAGVRPPAAARDTLARAIEAAGADRYLQPAPGSWSWRWRAEVPEPDRILGAVALSAERLLTSEEAALVRSCANAGCGWLFVDRSRGHRRRWCDMKVCGNNAKARAFYLRRARSAR